MLNVMSHHDHDFDPDPDDIGTSSKISNESAMIFYGLLLLGGGIGLRMLDGSPLPDIVPEMLAIGGGLVAVIGVVLRFRK